MKTLVERFLRQLGSEQTRRAYRHDLRKFRAYLSDSAREDVFPDGVTNEHLDGFVSRMADEGLSTATRRRRVSAVRRFFDWLCEIGELSTNPVRGPLRVSGDAEPTSSDDGRFLTAGEIESLLDAIDRSTDEGRRTFALVLVILYGSLRRAEVSSLNIEDVRPLGRHWVIDLSQSSSGAGGYVPIPDPVVDAVQSLTDVYGAESGPLWRSFSNRNWGERLSPDAIYKSLRRAGEEIGLEGLTIERLRQSGLRLASAGGASIQAVQAHARLQSPRTSARYAADDTDADRLGTSLGDRIPIDLSPYGRSEASPRTKTNDI